MTELYKNQDWLYSLLHDESSGDYYLQVVCGTIGWYEVALRLTETEAATFLQDLAAHHSDNMTALAKAVLNHGHHGIPGREYLR
jgi:hypothetical protein